MNILARLWEALRGTPRAVPAPSAPPAPAAPEGPSAGTVATAKAIDLIIEFEQSGKFAPAPYLDPVGVPTQGYGSIWNWRVSPRVRVTMQDAPITDAEAHQWLALELVDVIETLAKDVKVPLTEGERAALIDFIYNLGAGNFVSSTLLRKLNAGDYEGAAQEFPKWDRAGGEVLAGLVRRRAAEQAMFQS